MDPIFLKLLCRLVLINLLPFFLVFSLTLRRRRQRFGVKMNELVLVADEINTVGILGYVVILSIFFFSIPVLRYMHDTKGYDILLVEPDGYTVFLLAFFSFSLVVGGVYLKARRHWAYWLLNLEITLLLVAAFFTVLDIGAIGIVPIIVFSYLLYKLKSPALKQEFEVNKI